MKSRSVPSSAWWATWRSHTFSERVRGSVMGNSW
jgi:hypothetical protein